MGTIIRKTILKDTILAGLAVFFFLYGCAEPPGQLIGYKDLHTWCDEKQKIFDGTYDEPKLYILATYASWEKHFLKDCQEESKEKRIIIPEPVFTSMLEKVKKSYKPMLASKEMSDLANFQDSVCKPVDEAELQVNITTKAQFESDSSRKYSPKMISLLFEHEKYPSAAGYHTQYNAVVKEHKPMVTGAIAWLTVQPGDPDSVALFLPGRFIVNASMEINYTTETSSDPVFGTLDKLKLSGLPEKKWNKLLSNERVKLEAVHGTFVASDTQPAFVKSETKVDDMPPGAGAYGMALRLISYDSADFCVVRFKEMSKDQLSSYVRHARAQFISAMLKEPEINAEAKSNYFDYQRDKNRGKPEFDEAPQLGPLTYALMVALRSGHVDMEQLKSAGCTEGFQMILQQHHISELINGPFGCCAGREYRDHYDKNIAALKKWVDNRSDSSSK